MKRFAVIGRAGHARRLIDLLRARTDLRLAAVYHPKPSAQPDADLPLGDDFDDVLRCDAIVIASPTDTHAAYLERLRDHPGHVLVEKPAVSTPEQTAALRAWPAERRARVAVNYCYPHAPVPRRVAALLASGALGRPAALSLRTSHGLAFRDDYRQGWRSDARRSLGVLELVGVHFVHLAATWLGALEQTGACYQWLAGGEGRLPPDSVALDFRTADAVRVELSHGYAGPFLHRMLLVGSDGYLEYDGRTLRHCGPRDCFDDAGRFCDPPLIDAWTLPFAEQWREGLERSLDGFVAAVQADRPFPPEDLERALDAMAPVFRARAALDLR